MVESSKPAAPVPSPETLHYWERAREGELHIKSCNSCAKVHFYPRIICPFCGSNDTYWIEVSGTGVIYSFSIMRRSARPYVIAYVELAEGPRLMTNIIVTDVDEIKIGLPVKLDFLEAQEGYRLPIFKPLN